MSYIKTQWQNGQEPPINAENLNKIEQGIYEAHQKAEEKYTKPSLGIPKNDLAESVKDSLNNADSALQDDDVDSTLSPTSTNPVQNKMITNKIAGTDRRLDALYELTQGQAWDFETVENTTNPVIVPAGAKMCNLQKISGKTVVWNQLVNTYFFNDNVVSGIARRHPDVRGVHYVGTSTQSTAFTGTVSFPSVNGHKYLVEAVGTNLPTGVYPKFAYFDSGSTNPKIITATSDVTNNSIGLYIPSGTSIDTDVWFNFHDLTQMFGAGNEPATVEDFWIAWIKKYAALHPEYKAGEIISFACSEVETVGFNLWDEEWEKNGISPTTGLNNNDPGRIRSKNHIPCMPNTVYNVVSSMTTDDIRFCYYDEDKEFISASPWRYNGTFITPSNAHYMRFYTGIIYGEVYKNDICINISNTALNGNYKPYHTETIELPIADYFPDGIKSAVSVRDEITRDKAVKRAGTYTFTSDDEWRYWYDDNFYCMKQFSKDGGQFLSSRYISGTAQIDKSCFSSPNTKYFYVKDSSYSHDSAGANQLKQDMIGTTVNYELAEPIETAVTDWIEPFEVEAGGTITFVDGEENSIPTNTTEEYTVKLSEVVTNG